MKKLYLITILFLLSAVFQSCSDDSVNSNNNPPTGNNLTNLGTGTNNGIKITLYSDTILFTGYNKLYVELKDSASGSIINNATVSIMPMMDMGSMQHSCPYDNPVGVNTTNNMFPCAAVFIMSSMGGTWTLNVDVIDNVYSRIGSITFPLTVTDPAYSKLKSKIVNGSTYFMSLIEPSKPIVGINDLIIKVNKRVSMMSFPNDSSYTFGMYPWMPSMGHSSPNNVNPVYSSSGMYNGRVNFTMTGDWRITMTFQESPQDSVSFDLVF